MLEAFFVAIASVWADSGFSALTGGHVIMIGVGLVLLYMAIGKDRKSTRLNSSHHGIGDGGFWL